MKVLLVNKFLYPRGGDCIYTLNLGRLLRKAGHCVQFYAMAYPENLQDENEACFAEEVSFSSISLSGKIKAARRILWGTGVRSGFEKILDSFQPDIVHLNNIHSYLSPVVARLAHQRGIKVVWTLHDYKLLCPSYNCLCRGEICEMCFTCKTNVLFRKCMKNNVQASVLAMTEAIRWNREKLSGWTDTFICPSHFLAKKMKEGGYAEDKLQVIPNFIGEEQSKYILDITDNERENAYAYIGRLSKEKGVEGLLEAAAWLPYKLYVVGSGPAEKELMKKYAADTIIFLGHQTTKGVMEILKKVSFTVLPSIWYENNPLGIIESLCCGTPVLGRNIGGIPELLETENCNQLFRKDEELTERIVEMFSMSAATDRNMLSTSSLQRFSGEQYYQMWLRVVERK